MCYKSAKFNKKVNPRTAARRIDTEVPSIKVPSCSGLPPGWENTHDQFIAYLSTHSPLTRDGKVPDDNHATEYTYRQISLMIQLKFQKFRRFVCPMTSSQSNLGHLQLHSTFSVLTLIIEDSRLGN